MQQINWSVVWKIAGSILGVAGYAVNALYQSNPNATKMGFIMAAVGAVASYLLGLFQAQPTRDNQPKPMMGQDRQEAP